MTDLETTEEETPALISESEELGRGVFSGRDARAAERGQVRATVFLERQGVREISVDRITLAPPDEAVDEWEQRQCALELATGARWLGRPR